MTAEPTVLAARRLIDALRRYGKLTRRQAQAVLYPDQTYDVRRASDTAVVIAYCRDRGWVRSYGRQFLPTVDGLAQLEIADAIQPVEAS